MRSPVTTEPPDGVPMLPDLSPDTAEARAALKGDPSLVLVPSADHALLVQAHNELHQEKAALRVAGQWLVERGYSIVGLVETETGTVYELEPT